MCMTKINMMQRTQDITLTWDDADLIVNKVQDRSEQAVKTTEEHREQIMAKMIEFHVHIQQLRDHTESQATMQQQKAVPRPPAQKHDEDTIQFFTQGSDTFTITPEMI
jgi:hypothetical protein